MTDIEVCTHNHKHRIHDYTKQTHECMTTHKSNTSSVQAQTSLLVSVVCRGMYGRLVEAVPSLKQEPCSLFHCSQYQYVQEEGLVGYYSTMYDGHFTSRVAARKKTKNQTRSTQTSHCGEDGSKAATTEDKA